MKKKSQKWLSLFFVLAIVLSATLVGIAAAEMRAAGDPAPLADGYYDKEYYYPPGTQFITDLAVSARDHSGTAGGREDEAKGYITGAGYTLLGKDLNAGKNSSYIHMGYKKSSDESKAIRAFGFYNGSTYPESLTYNINGHDCTFYPLKNSYIGSNTSANAPLDLNREAGGDTIYLYYTTDPNAGPPMTRIEYSSSNSAAGLTVGVWLNTNGDRYAGDPADVNRGVSGSDDIFLFYAQESSTEVDTDALRTAVNSAASKNSANYTSDTYSALQSAYNTGNAIVTDYNSYGLSGAYDQSAINSATTVINNAINALKTTVYLNPNGGTLNGSTATISTTVQIGGASSYGFSVAGYTPTRTGYTFKGWATSSSATSGTTGNINVGFNNTLYAVWEANKYSVVFDNLVDLSQWNTSSASNGTFSNVTENGFTLTSNDGASEATSQSPLFPVTAGKQYKIDIDFTGDAWDVYIFFYDANTSSGLGLEFKDGPTNRYSANGSTGITADNAVFTAPAGAVRAAIRVDANGSNNTVRYENIRVYEVGSIEDGAPYVPSKSVTYNSTYGELPTPTRDRYEFLGWYKADGTKLEATDTVNVAGNTYVTSKWKLLGYTITWKVDGQQDVVSTVEAGKMPVYPNGTPEKAATAQYTYTFTGWEPALEAATADKTYTAQFSQTTNKYNVTWKVDGKPDVVTSVEYGTVPAYPNGTPTKAADAQYTYTFANWDTTPVAVTKDVTYTAVFDKTVNTYTVTWLDEDNSVLETDTNVPYGATPSYDRANPTKAANAQYSYEFDKWSPDVTTVTGNATYKATYKATLNQYKVTWNIEGETTDETYDYGSKPSYKGDTPTKPADDQYTYTFAGWNPAIDDNTTVTGPVTYTAVFDKTVNRYTIKFVNEDGSELQSSEFEYGATPVYTGSTPTKAATAQYTYTFDGWTTAIEKVTGEATYTAKYKETVNKYTIKFVNEDGSELQSSEVAYGETPAYTGAEPTKEATAQYTYTFDGWTTAIEKVTGEATYTAKYKETVNKYIIKFVNEDGTELQSNEVAYGETPAYTGAEPTKVATAQYTYTFDGWTTAIEKVTGEATYTAKYKETVNKYTITWHNYNGDVLGTSEVEYDATPEYVGATPTKAADAQYTYTFKGWTPAVVAVTGPATYVAEFDATVNTYTVTWVNDDNSVLETDEDVPYGATPSYDGATPTKEKDAQYTYTFDKWVSDSDSETVTGNVTYKATYTTKTNTYTVTWKNENGTVLETDINVPYGATPSFDQADPTKAATDKFTYTFAGWDPEVSTVTGDVTYTATYTETVNEYTITWIVDGQKTTTQVAYGETPSIADPTKASTAEYNYTFAGWTPAVVAVTGDATYTATFNENPNEYTITWTADGETVKTATVAYGAQIVNIPEVPNKDGYVGVWENVPATMPAHDLTIQAKYSQNVITVTWIIDGTEYKTVVEYGNTPAYTGTPTKASTAKYEYTFKGWSETEGGSIVTSFPEASATSGNKTYYAVFDETVRKYNITWANDNGTTIKTESVAYGETPEYVGATPTKTATAQYTYTFKDWSPAIVAVTEDATYTATYTATVNEYTIKFVDEDGNELQSSEVAYGETPAYTGNTPVKTGDEQYSYVFTGWTPAIVDVTEDATYTATFQQVVNEYTVTWVVEGTTVETDEHVPYGTEPTFNGSTPTKAADAQYTYTFAGWDPAVSAITGDTTYTATFDKTVNKYTVTWANDDGSVIKTEEVEYGTMASYTGETPTKEATAQYTFTFDGWDKEFAEVKDDVTYTAKYTETLNKYTVTWVVEGVTVETDTEVEYGATPSYDGEEPTKAGDAETSYTFAGWTPAIEKVTGNVTYTATFTSATNTYTVTWIVDGVESTTLVEYGKTPEYDGTPTKAADAQYTYEFAGWDPVVDKVTGDATYTAVFTKTDRLYTITWIVDGKTTTEQYKYNEVPSFKGSTDKPSTEGASYVFAGWDKELANVTADATYTAKYNETVRMFTITWIVGDQEIKQQWAYGTVPSFNGSTDKAPSATATYTFAGWDKTPVEAKSDATYTATYTETVRKYTVVWYVDGQFFATQDVAYNTVIPTPGLPAEKEGYSVRWDNTVTVMPAGDVEIHAIYTPKMYPVYWIVDGLTVYSASVPFGGTIPTMNVPAKEGYTGKWVNIPETMPAGIVTIEAEYTARSYQVFWKIGDAQGTDTATYGNEYVLTFDIAELPEALRITVNNAVIPEDSYNYDSIAGTLTIYGSAITGNISIVARSTSGTVNISNSIFGGSSSNTNAVIEMRTTYHTTITPAAGYLLPKTVQIFVDGILLTSGYTYDATSGRLTINAEVIIGELEIYAECEEDPDYNPTENCSCSCHSKNALVKFFFEIFNFLRKLFGMEKYHYCECGVSHW